MDVLRFRQVLAEFLGPAKYRRFIEQLRGKNRLRAWQEDAIAEFEIAHAEYTPLSHEQLLAALSICELHGEELKTYSIRVVEGSCAISADYVKARVAYFPNAKFNFWPRQGAPLGCDIVEKLYCSLCCTAESEWEVRYRHQ